MNRSRRLLSAFPLLWAVPGVHAGQALSVALPSDVLDDYFRFLAGRDPHAITDFAGLGARRDVVEVVLLTQALRLGGLNASLHFQRVDSYSRILRELETGRADMAANSVWLADVKPRSESMFVSEPVLAPGSLEAVLYTSARNQQARSARTLADLRALRFISNQSWTADWATLNQLKLPKLQSTATWSSMVNMVIRDRADVLLAPLQPTPDGVLKIGSDTLVVIPHMKVKLLGSRHFVVSRHRAGSEKVFEALQKGLRTLRQTGQIDRAYQAAGLFQPQLQSWLNLNELAASQP